MELKYTGENKRVVSVPGGLVVEPGDVFEVPDDVGKRLNPDLFQKVTAKKKTTKKKGA